MKKICKHELNYAKVYYLNGSTAAEGFLSNWEFGLNHQTVTLWFIDGTVIRTSVNYVFMMHKDYDD